MTTTPKPPTPEAVLALARSLLVATKGVASVHADTILRVETRHFVRDLGSGRSLPDAVARIDEEPKLSVFLTSTWCSNVDERAEAFETLLRRLDGVVTSVRADGESITGTIEGVTVHVYGDREVFERVAVAAFGLAPAEGPSVPAARPRRAGRKAVRS